jgi:MYXO-CTERM domain-containing protein
MRASLVFAVVLAGGLAFARAASADQTECPIGEIGQPCGQNGSTCIDATCCDDPNGCAYDAGPIIIGSSGSSSSGGSTGTGVSRACAVCEFLGQTYCAPADLGKACPDDAGVCSESGGGGGPLVELDGGTTNVSFTFTVCGPSDGFGDDDGGGFASGGGGSSGSGGGSTSGSSSGGTGFGTAPSSGGSASSGSSSSGSSSSGGSGSSSGGAGNETVTAGCGVAPSAPSGSPWGVGVSVALGIAAIARRRRSARDD